MVQYVALIHLLLKCSKNKHKYHSLGINLDKMLPSPWRLAKIACTDITHDVNFLVV